MSGVRLDRFLASTAVALFLSAAPLAALAEPMSHTATDAGKTAMTPANSGFDRDADTGTARLP